MSPGVRPTASVDGRGERGGDAAVSSVVSAVLVVALLVTVSTLWTVTTLPQWVADREEDHARSVQASFSALQSGLESLSAADDEGPSTVPVDLGPRAVPLVQPVAASGELRVADATTATATFTDESILLVDQSPVGEAQEPIAEGAGEEVAGIELLQALVVLLETSDVGNDDEAWVEVVADDGDDTVTARMTHAGKLAGAGPNEAGCLNSELRLEVTIDIAPVAPSTSVQALLCELAEDLTGYSLDLVSPAYPFADAVARLATPFTLTLTDDAGGGSAAADGYYSLAYVDADGQESGVGGGQPTDYTMDVQGLRLVYDPAYREYTDHAVAWDLGGVALEQADGQAMVGAPSFDLVVKDGRGTLRWTFVELEGEGSRSGGGQATARLLHERTSEVVLSATGASFSLDTPSAAAWRSFLATEVLVAGASADAAVGGAGDTATLTLSTSEVAEWRIHLRVLHATLEVL